MNKKDRNLTLIVGAIILTIGSGIWLTYYISMKRSNEEALKQQCLRNIDQEFKGTLIEVERFEYDNFMYNRFFNLHIKLNGSKNEAVDYHYNLTPKTKPILEVAVKGQTIIKRKGQDTFTIVDDRGNKREFKIAKCE